ncbi:GNAT family N-acetyltransferase [Sporocytophaga myxococcoides]|uniref:GNAT family N-acetyltransferase n=1 Tax=Sporocytophaga myxococcoides TaxID=153721 RepID=UPI001B7FA29A
MTVLQTDRLIIKEYKAEYLMLVQKVFSDPLTMSFWPSPFTKEETSKWIERSILSYKEYGFGRYAIFLNETNELIGDCGILKLQADNTIVHDLGYIIYAPFWNHGFAFEAAEAIMNYGFKVLNIEKLYANMPYNHNASIKVAEKIGMKRIKEFNNSKNRSILTYLYSSVNPKILKKMGQEIERKFLIKKDIWEYASKGKASYLKQGYISTEPGKTIRVRVTEDKSFLTIKGKTEGIARAEFEYEIPEEDANELLNLFAANCIEKVRHEIIYDGKLWEVDVFSGDNDGLIIAEIELNSIDEKFSLPAWIDKEVSGDERYFNSNLSKNPFKKW